MNPAKPLAMRRLVGELILQERCSAVRTQHELFDPAECALARRRSTEWKEQVDDARAARQLGASVWP